MCDYEVRAAGQKFYFIGPMAWGRVGSKRGRGSAGRTLQPENGQDTQMERNYRSMFNHNQQVNSSSVNKRSESSPVPDGFVNY